MRYFRTLTLSLILHIGLAIVLALIIPAPVQFTKPMVVDLMETPELPTRPQQKPRDEKEFVRAAIVPPEDQTKEKQKARFSSQDDQNVLRETQARQSGLTANRSQEASKGIPGLARKPGEKKSEKSIARGKLDFQPNTTLKKWETEDLENGFGNVKVASPKPEPKPQDKLNPDGSRAFQLPSFMGAERGASTNGEALPADVAFADFTALNTDRNLYYSFYSRMEEAIRNRWVAYAKAVLFSYENGRLALPLQENLTTRLEVILDPNGKFVKAIIRDSSGIRGLDSAPVQAFFDAKQFANPPPEMVKSDGAIHIDYAFTVNIGPRVAAGRPDN